MEHGARASRRQAPSARKLPPNLTELTIDGSVEDPNSEPNQSAWAHWPTLLVACVATFLVPLDVTIMAVALPDIERQLHTSFTQLQWVVGSYNVAYTACLLAAGTVADRFGRRRVLQLGLGTFLVTSLMAGLAQDPTQLIVARALPKASAAASC